MINEEEVKKLAVLSRLTLPQGEKLQALQITLDDILEMVKQLQAVDTEEILPLSHPIEMYQRLREDVVSEQDEHLHLQKSAPLTNQGFYLVPAVLD